MNAVAELYAKILADLNREAERERRLRQEFETRTTGMPASGLR